MKTDIMTDKPKNRFFLNHAKSSAMVVSLGIHAVLIVVAISFVAVRVVQKADKQFEAPKVNRPRLPPKKLQVPVKMKKKRPKPKLRKQITVKTRMDRKMPDIKMPEITGIKGGLGSAAVGNLGSVAGVGFTMPEIEVFGVKSRGEKVFLVLDSREYIMYDEVGGLAGYTIIKDELARIIGSLPPTTLFNIAVFDRSYSRGGTYTLFKNMVPANQANVGKIAKWLESLNKVTKDMKADQFGVKTLGSGGHKVSEDFVTGKIKRARSWYPAVAEAMREQADTVFLLASIYGWLHDGGERLPMSKLEKKKWDECYQKALKLYKEENERLLADGKPPRVLSNHDWEMNKAYFPDIVFPSHKETYWYTPKDFERAFDSIRKKYKPSAGQMKSGLRKNKKDTYSVNIIQFMPNNPGDEFLEKYQARYDASVPRFKGLTGRFGGQYRAIKGMEEIKRSAGR